MTCARRVHSMAASGGGGTASRSPAASGSGSGSGSGGCSTVGSTPAEPSASGLGAFTPAAAEDHEAEAWRQPRENPARREETSFESGRAHQSLTAAEPQQNRGVGAAPCVAIFDHVTPPRPETKSHSQSSLLRSRRGWAGSWQEPPKTIMWTLLSRSSSSHEASASSGGVPAAQRGAFSGRMFGTG